MRESLESIFRRVINSHGYVLPNGGLAMDAATIESLVQTLSDVAEARCELIRQEGHDQGWLDCEEFHDIRTDS